MVVDPGSGPPMPSPAMNRSAAIVVTSGEKPIEQVAAPKRNTLAITAMRRPKRSANRPAQALPIAMPSSPAATAGASAPRVMPHSLMIEGRAKPISWPSKPSVTMAIAAMKTTTFCIVVYGPSSRTRPISTGADAVVVVPMDLVSRCFERGLRSGMTACRQDGAAAFTEADTPRAAAFAVATKDDAVTVFEERACFAVGQMDRLLAALAEFEERAGLRGIRPRQRAGAEEVASLQVAAVDR